MHYGGFVSECPIFAFGRAHPTLSYPVPEFGNPLVRGTITMNGRTTITPTGERRALSL